ncbi:MAG: patatin-like phospholipase family protein [Hyphomicrobiales bacterium]|nr:patatin-like phospholipase family protein [Hyphomicrobiales bacterium]
MSTKIVNLALQGGGTLGAFTWGVLERLLQEPDLALEGISATSSGAINAVLVAHGLTAGGREGATAALTDFWDRLAQLASTSLLQPSWYDRALSSFGLEYSPGYLAADLMSRIFSPYQFNPLNFDPVRAMLEEIVDFDALRRRSAIQLFLCATNVRTGKIRVFVNHEINVDCVLASACLPSMHQAVEIDGEPYWDGGYLGNPALYPLIYDCKSNDIVVIHTNPTERHDIPRTAPDIINRINEISFNSSLMREMRAIAFVTKLIDDHKITDGSVRRMLMHAIAADDVMESLGPSSKLNADREFLEHLRGVGRARAGDWLKANLALIGVASTIDIRAKYL